MRSWPLPESDIQEIPTLGAPGSFWEDRGDRRHCGVDLYAPSGAEVVSIEDGIVLNVGLCTSPEIIPYWNATHYVLVKNESGLFSKYAELEWCAVGPGDRLRSGQTIGKVGSVLNLGKIGKSAPPYIRCLKNAGNQSMLHFELYRSQPRELEDYLGGNWFGEGMPPGLIDPTEYLLSIT